MRKPLSTEKTPRIVSSFHVLPITLPGGGDSIGDEGDRLLNISEEIQTRKTAVMRCEKILLCSREFDCGRRKRGHTTIKTSRVSLDK